MSERTLVDRLEKAAESAEFSAARTHDGDLNPSQGQALVEMVRKILYPRVPLSDRDFEAREEALIDYVRTGFRAAEDALMLREAVQAVKALSTAQQENADLRASNQVLRSALELAESVYRLNVVQSGEPSSVLNAMQAALASPSTTEQKDVTSIPPMRANPCQCEIYQTCEKCMPPASPATADAKTKPA